MTVKILIPDTIELSLPDEPGIQFERYSVSGLREDQRDADGIVLWSVDSASTRRIASQLTRLRWVQTLSAGYENVLAAGFPEQAIITNGRGLHTDTVAEHALALSLAAVRSLPVAFRAQQAHEWASCIGGPQTESSSGPLITLSGARVTIWGFGSIGVRLAQLYQELGATVTGVARTAGTRSGFPVVAGQDVDELLPRTDLLVMVLPASSLTHHILDAARIQALPSRAWVLNVGRGSTVDEAALTQALSSRTIAGAGLDVFEQEPLPADSPLWSLPNVIITPHAAGGRPRGAARLVLANARALMTGQPLTNVVS